MMKTERPSRRSEILGSLHGRHHDLQGSLVRARHNHSQVATCCRYQLARVACNVVGADVSPGLVKRSLRLWDHFCRHLRIHLGRLLLLLARHYSL